MCQAFGRVSPLPGWKRTQRQALVPGRSPGRQPHAKIGREHREGEALLDAVTTAGWMSKFRTSMASTVRICSESDVAARTEPRAGAERQEGAADHGDRRLVPSTPAREPAFGERVETAGIREMLLARGFAADQHHDRRASRNVAAHEFDVADRFQDVKRRHRLEAHGLVVEGIDEWKLLRLFQGFDGFSRCDESVDLLACPVEVFRILHEVVNGPAGGVGRRVLPGQQQCPGVGKDVCIGEPRPLILQGSKNGFDEIGRLGLLRHALPGGADHGVDLLLETVERPGERPVRRHRHIAPIGKGRIDPAMQHGEHLVEMTLDHRPRGLQRVGIDTEGKADGDVDGETHEIAAEIDCVSSNGCLLPVPPQAFGRHDQAWEEILEMRTIERGGNDPALTPPVVAFSGKDALQPHFRGDRFQRPRAPERLRALDEESLNRRPVRHHDDIGGSDTDPVDRTVTVRPFLEMQMQSREPDLVEVADQREATRSGKIPDPGRCRGGFLVQCHGDLPNLKNLAPTDCSGGDVTMLQAAPQPLLDRGSPWEKGRGRDSGKSPRALFRRPVHDRSGGMDARNFNLSPSGKGQYPGGHEGRRRRTVRGASSCPAETARRPAPAAGRRRRPC